MSRADRERWDARHAALDPGTPAPPAALGGRLDLLPPGGRALELACGRGVVAVWLARHGFAVEAVDVSGAGLDAGARLAERHGVAVTWIEADLDDGIPEGCRGPYDLVVCQRFRDPRLYPAMAALLRPGGLLAVTVLSQVGDGSGPFRAAPGELVTAFAGLEVLVDAEGDGEAHLVARHGEAALAPAPPR
ncbi:class I SAM-dependent methyltransferase [Pseudonocardia asaccharolytica]|uniref:SAM-dependent methyltransferase n=1 Tax=Pseudonocardia asaccharolytica DSM 44247 = NBRC 16224 TaxID=1123024 RepID=A0A511D2N3_9PSEU|nr:class I SAM-dependent methyltransferase [Pseudonocardia asaccharolytica]GEL19049.1 SAM-dependent methyltransferase [Pseudonocardia asaccharolytica DSM 44247 = NBRC 16224]